MSREIGFSRKGAEGPSAQRYSENQLAGIVVDLALRVHRDLGPGLLESVYEKVIASGLRERGLDVKCQVPVPVSYRNMQFDDAFRADLIVNDKLMIELKALECIKSVHKRQLLTYLKLSGIRLGLLLNFGEPLMRKGIVRLVNKLPEEN